MYVYNLGIRFQAVAAQHAGRRALWFGAEDGLTYAGLNSLANRTARWLLEQGVGPGDVVCLSGSKSSQTFALLLACLKVGAPYSVLDPDSPAERLRKILGTCRPRLLVAEPDLLANLQEPLRDLSIRPAETGAQGYAADLDRFDDTDLPQTRAVTGTSPAYIMYTSGSTGFPKGAVMTHANVLNLIGWSTETYRITPDDVLTNVNPLYFDNSVFDLYSALFTGACLVPFTKDEARDPLLLTGKVDAARCTLWFSVPSLLIFLQTMKAADGRRLRSIRRFVFGGEGYPKAKLKRLYDTYSDTAQLHNVYGPTECTCICSSYRLSDSDFEDVQGLPPLGSIADNFQYLILDDDGREVPAGETGELCLLGANVGRGYYNDPERTAAAFVQNPRNRAFAEVIYRTGDLVRLNPEDGKLHIHGRKDNQIKHMGYRIELEEIEAALHCLEYVSEAAALHSSASGLSRLAAVGAVRHAVEPEKVRQDLRRIIPDYMVPTHIHFEEMLPKNANGKVDRRRLAEKYLRGGAPGKAGQ